MSGTVKRWATRTYRDGDEEGIFRLWKAVYPDHPYNRDQWMKWWRWMYRANPNGVGIICVVEDDGKIVGHVAEVPVMLKVGSEDILATLGLDAMTHPDYRRRGILAEVAGVRHEEDLKQGVRATYSFPNKLSYAATAKRGLAFDIATVQKVARPLNWRNALGTQTNNKLLLTAGTMAGIVLSATLFRARKATVPGGLTITRVPCFDDRIDGLWRRASSQYRVLVRRSKDYLNWRYVDVPERDYSIYIAEQSETVVGYLVLSRKNHNGAELGILVDVFAESEKVTQCLIAEAFERCKRDKVDVLIGARIAGTSLAKDYRRNGFLLLPHASAPVTGFSFAAGVSEQLKCSKNWFLQMGDSDYE